MALEVLTAVAAISGAVYLLGWAVAGGGTGGVDASDRSRSRALELLNADLGDAGRTVLRQWRPGNARALR